MTISNNKVLIAWLFSIFVTICLLRSDNTECGTELKSNLKYHQQSYSSGEKANNDVTIVIDDVVDINRRSPIIFVGGVPRSGTTLMRALLDAHPDIRCGQETRIVPQVLFARHEWSRLEPNKKRLKLEGLTDEMLDSATSALMFDIISKHGKSAKHLCNKDPLLLTLTTRMKRIFPYSKYILMIRDGRAVIHSMITRKVTVGGFDLQNFAACMSKWNTMIKGMYSECILVGPRVCMPVYYEELILKQEKSMRRIFEFLDIPFDAAVLRHEEFVGDEIVLSSVEPSTNQVVKAVNVDALSKWIGQIPMDVEESMDSIAPMLRLLGYDFMEASSNYTSLDGKSLQFEKNIEIFLKYANNTNIDIETALGL